MPAIDYQPGTLAGRENSLALEVAKRKVINNSYAYQMGLYQWLKANGRTRKVMYGEEIMFHGAPSPDAGARDMGDRLPGPVRNIGGAERRFSHEYKKASAFLSTFYAGRRMDGLYADVAGNPDNFANLETFETERCMDELSWQEELAMGGVGDGSIGEVSAGAGTDTLTLKKADNTVALAGFPGLARIRHPNRAI